MPWVPTRGGAPRACHEAPTRVELHRHRFARRRLVHERADHLQQEVQLEVEPRQFAGEWMLVFALVAQRMLFDGDAGLQQQHVGFLERPKRKESSGCASGSQRTGSTSW
jgi:hypothetical protein